MTIFAILNPVFVLYCVWISKYQVSYNKAMTTKKREVTIVPLKPLTFEELIKELAKTPKYKDTVHRLEDYEPGATPAQVLKALKKVAKAKPSHKPS